MTHTPGPWLLEGHTIYALVPHYGWYEDGKVMMTNRFTAHVQRGHESTPDELDDNARLIAAAPELYEYVESSASAGCATAKALLEKIRGNT